jgi:hypothetical protein
MPRPCEPSLRAARAVASARSTLFLSSPEGVGDAFRASYLATVPVRCAYLLSQVHWRLPGRGTCPQAGRRRCARPRPSSALHRRRAPDVFGVADLRCAGRRALRCVLAEQRVDEVACVARVRCAALCFGLAECPSPQFPPPRQRPRNKRNPALAPRPQRPRSDELNMAAVRQSSDRPGKETMRRVAKVDFNGMGACQRVRNRLRVIRPSRGGHGWNVTSDRRHVPNVAALAPWAGERRQPTTAQSPVPRISKDQRKSRRGPPCTATNRSHRRPRTDRLPVATAGGKAWAVEVYPTLINHVLLPSGVQLAGNPAIAEQLHCRSEQCMYRMIPSLGARRLH